jgi:hypothetical protein
MRLMKRARLVYGAIQNKELAQAADVFVGPSPTGFLTATS